MGTSLSQPRQGGAAAAAAGSRTSLPSPNRRPHSMQCASSSSSAVPTQLDGLLRPSGFSHGPDGQDHVSEWGGATASSTAAAASTASSVSHVHQQLQAALNALPLDWAIIDNEMELVTAHLAATLLTSRLRTQSFHQVPGMPLHRPRSRQRGVEEYDAAEEEEDDYGEAAAGPRELYVSAALRLSALHLGRKGLKRIVVALAYLANGDESQEERKLRKTSSTSISHGATSSSLEINHFQRGMGFTGAAASATAVCSPALTASPGAAVGYVGFVHSHTGSSSVPAARKFSTAQHARQPPAPHPSSPMPIPSEARAPLCDGFRASAALGQRTLSPPVHRGVGVHQHSDTLKPPTVCSSDDATPLLGQSVAIAPLPPQCIMPSESPLGGGGTDALVRPRRVVDAAFSTTFSHGEESYNNGLLRTMNARSSMVSTLRTGAHGELLLSSSSIATIMSMSTASAAAGAVRTPREEHLGGLYSGSSGHNAIHSLTVGSAYSTTQCAAPQARAPSTGMGIATSVSGLTSPNASNPHSLPSLAALCAVPEPQRWTQRCSRRSRTTLRPQLTEKFVPAGARIHHTGVPSDDLTDVGSSVPRHLPPAIGGGVVMCADVYSGVHPLLGPSRRLGDSEAHPPSSPSATCLGTPLQLLPPEAVLAALCNVFAHLHLSSDDVTNFVTLLVVAALEMQNEARIRPLAAVPGGGLHIPGGAVHHVDSLDTPSSVAQIRAAVRECLRLCLYPMYEHTCRMLRAVAGAVANDLSSAAGGSSSGAFVPQQERPPHQARAGRIELDITLRRPFLTTSVPTGAACNSAHLTRPCSGFTSHTWPPPAPPTATFHALPESNGAAENLSSRSRDSSSTAAVPTNVQAVHDFFAASLPIECASSLLEATAVAAAPSVAAKRSVTMQRYSGTSPQQPSSVAAAATSSHSSSEGTLGLTSSGSLSHSTATDTATGSAHNGAAASQESVRCANHYLIDLETAFVFHYAEALPNHNSSRRGSFPSAAAAPPTHTPPDSPSDADRDMLVQFSPGSTLWPLRTRLLVRRHHYVYAYDAVASTMALLGEDYLYPQEPSVESRSETQRQPSRVLHPHTPIAVIDLSKAAAEKAVNDVQVLRGFGDVEILNLMPSHVSRASGLSQRRHSSAASTSLGGGSQPSRPGSRHSSAADEPRHIHGGTSHPPGGSFSGVLAACWADADNRDVEVYRMKGSSGTMHLLSLPAEEEQIAGAPLGAPVDGMEALQRSVIRRFERNRYARPVALAHASPTANSSAVAGTGGADKPQSRRTAKEGAVAAEVATPMSASIQCGYGNGAREVLALDPSIEPTCIASYPLRLLYQGVLHHFFFANPSTRNQWDQRLVQLSWMMQSPTHLEKVVAAPHHVERYLRNRISFPIVPGAFDCLDMLGVGTFGRVLLVEHKLSKHLFAMKVIRKSGFHGVRNVIEVRREKILYALDCPYIMKIHGSFQTNSRVYMLFDYLPGAELLLHTQLAHEHHFDEATSRFYIAELAVAVEYLRVRGIVHRDIKGDNLVLDSEGHVVLTDFGFAKSILAEPEDPNHPARVIRQHTSCGTLAYIAPEVLCSSRRRSGYGPAVDWWSLGVVLFTLLTGYFPFLKPTGPATSHAIVHSALQFPPQPSLSQEARSLLQQLLQKDPASRITSLAKLRRHPFFNGFDWAACLARRLPPPLVLHKDLYRSPRHAAEAQQLLRDRVRRSLAWSASTSSSPHEPPAHSREPGSHNLPVKLQAPLEEEKAELRLVEDAYGAERMPKPLSESSDVFGPLFQQQERCGSDRDESDVEDLRMEDYYVGAAQSVIEVMKQLKDSVATLELCSSSSSVSLNSAHQERIFGTEPSPDENAHQKQRASPVVLSPMMAALNVPPLAEFTESMYANVALAKYAGGGVVTGAEH
ncbi:hypothetical protein GH5_06005 [Leishmania sp. Ghana 2012 LV757]|uniref:hypothetical protein n=1 Tax=Leishmania sp. Ghana 2012 LV757 TaxID=2803181 RepID=UPI001B722320|nr:hypothetical protein GH5_06005 [Leishmania sp. Ghana 2012 LV757]